MKGTLTLGFSPCPNDTFIFNALVNEFFERTELRFQPVIADVEELNRKALDAELDITKVSVAVYPRIEENYEILDSGAALGFNCGPILITRPGNDVSDLSKCTIAIPGRHTTANLLLSKAFPEATRKVELLFSEIEPALLKGTVDTGVIIHENRFTYQSKGLEKVMDLGEWWYEKTKLPIPLGLIVVKRDLKEHKDEVEQLVRESAIEAQANPSMAMPFVRSYAQEMEKDVMRQHIALYVNDFTQSLGPAGRQAIQALTGKSRAGTLGS